MTFKPIEIDLRCDLAKEGGAPAADGGTALSSGCAGSSPVPGLAADALQSTGAARFYIDCEFDGHSGPLLSIAIVPECGGGMHIRMLASLGPVCDPWVAENVIPIMDQHGAGMDLLALPNEVGPLLRKAMGNVERPVIIADSPVDIGRFCTAISTGYDGGWASTDYPQITFEVHNVDCYPTNLPGAVQHNAWWDAMALRHLLASADTRPQDEDATQIAASLASGAVPAKQGDAQ